MFSETKKNKRIRVLKDEEYQQIYGLPTFSREEQKWFFELTQQDQRRAGVGQSGHTTPLTNLLIKQGLQKIDYSLVHSSSLA
ncbi:MAG: hypothetical protein Q8R79_05310 [Legionellaceae bacterium]|nr:hypothetical protein [Legionellaceae bacterium]